MKFLVIGDFHGRFPIGLKSIVKKERIDFILSPGDYCGNEMVAKLFFEYYYDNEEEVPDEIEELMETYEKKGIRDGFEVIKKLKALNIPFLGIRGNWDPLDYLRDIGANPVGKDKSNAKRLLHLQERYFDFIDFSLVNMGDFLIIGGASSTNPGKIDKKTLRKVDLTEGKKEVKRMVKEYERRKKIYEKMFLRARKLKKPVIFLTHNCPYGIKLDKVKQGPAKGKHYGSFLEREMIRRFKPALVLCGHMHENQGRDKIGKSVIVNAGAFMDKKFAIVDWDEEKGRVGRVKFH